MCVCVCVYKSWFLESTQLYEQYYYLVTKWDIHLLLPSKRNSSADFRKHVNVCLIGFCDPCHVRQKSHENPDLSWDFPTSPSTLFPFPSQVHFPLPSVPHPCQGSQGHSDSQFLNLASLNSLFQIIPPHANWNTRGRPTALLFLRVWRRSLWSHEYLHVVGYVGCWGPVFRPLYPLLWGVRTGLVEFLSLKWEMLFSYT